jgi:alkanesulfonate monooxygenase SsuD/methylene tetrahydromethanopterin reductase-like flavin-dependent oxidoreductase (luciferase family)
MTNYANFRQRLDAVLRTLDVKQVSDFLIAEKQWQPGQPADPEFAMWMMVAGSPTLQDLHQRAREWLVTHGHEEDAKTFLTRDKQQGAKQGGRNPSTKKKK